MSHWTYLPFLLVWALPVIALQWLAGWRYLWRERRTWPWIVLGLGAYFSIADAVAISAQIWSFDDRALAGPTLGPVPLEEMLFYLLTAAMVVQGYVLFSAFYDERAVLIPRWRSRLLALRTRLSASLKRLVSPLQARTRPCEVAVERTLRPALAIRGQLGGAARPRARLPPGRNLRRAHAAGAAHRVHHASHPRRSRQRSDQRARSARPHLRAARRAGDSVSPSVDCSRWPRPRLSSLPRANARDLSPPFAPSA